MRGSAARARAALAALRPARPRPGAGRGPDQAGRFFFVVGRAKSGTTWLQRMLDAHPEILCRGEGRFFGREHQLGAPHSRSLSGVLAASEQLRDWAGRSVWTRDTDLDARIAEIAGAAARELMAGELAASGKRLAGDKTPLSSSKVVEEVAAASPGSRVIQITRDGRDVAVSSAHHVWNLLDEQPERRGGAAEQLAIRDAYRDDPDRFRKSGRSIFAAGELARTAGDWAELTAAARAQGAALLGARYAEVRYEDLLGSTGPGALAGVLEFLGADASAQTVRDCLSAASFERLSGRPPGVEDSTAFLRSGTAGGWREVFTDQDREIFDQAAGATLLELGYEPDRRWRARGA